MKMNEAEGKILGIDIGGTKTAVVLGDEDLNIIRRREFPTEPDSGFENFVERLSFEIDALVEREVPARAGVSVGGPMDANTGTLYNPPHLRWGTVNIVEPLEERFHFSVTAQHDGRAGALAESILGAGKGFSNIIFLTLGTGLGAGIIIDGKVYSGSKGLAGEVGHMRVADDGPSLFGKNGSWESYCGGTGISLYASYRFPERFRRGTTAEEIAGLALKGDAYAVIVLEESGTYFGKGLAVLLDILDPDRIILGNLAWRLPEVWLESAMKKAVCESLIGEEARERVVLSGLKDKIGDYAALIVASGRGGRR
ncbi:ROK family protein [Mesotoga sp. BH458_6_3_2_1]|nr:ROK family protein [Thermotogaceae bacterium]RLL84821.1 ROK family protein [Mesotoga sp. BH458_6_3_2_1]